IRDRNVTGVQTCALPISSQLFVTGLIRDDDSQPQALGNTFRLQTDEPPNAVEWYSNAEVLAGRLSERERVELELVGFSGTSINRSEERRVGKERRCGCGL